MSTSPASTQSAAERRAAEAHVRQLLATFAPAHQRLIGTLRRWLRKLLRGSGTQARWIAVEGASTLARPAIERLVDEALTRNPVPFAGTGRGPTVLRSASTK